MCALFSKVRVKGKGHEGFVYFCLCGVNVCKLEMLMWVALSVSQKIPKGWPLGIYVFFERTKPFFWQLGECC